MQVSMARSPAVIAQKLMMSRHNPNSNAFEFDGKRIHYMPPYPIKNQDYLMRGISQVIVETFVLPGFYRGSVQINKGDIVFDLGANIGTTALIFSEAVGPKGKVFAFEPVVHQTIRDNLRENKITNVEVVPAAVGDQDSEIEIEVGDFVLDSSITKRSHTQDYFTKKLKVPLMKLDTFIAQANIPQVHFVKMDIEGAEELALRGFTQGIRSMKPKWSISSYHIDFMNEPQHPKLVRILKDQGYSVSERGKSHIFAW